MSRQLLALLPVALIVAPIFPDVARAKPAPRVAVTSMTLFMQGDLKPSVRSISRQLTRGLARAGLSVISADQVLEGLAKHPNLQGCETPACLRKIGVLLQAPLCAQVKARGDQRKLQIEVVITWSHNGRQVVHALYHCPKCTVTRLEQTLSRLATEAGRKALNAYLTKPPPRGSRLPPGNGHTTRNGSGNGSGNGSASGKDSGRPYWITGLAILGAGALAFVPGGVLLGLHDKVTTRGCNQITRCRHDTIAGGITAAALGGAALVTGVTLLIYGLTRTRRTRPRVRIGVDPVRRTLVVSGQF